MLYIYAFVYLSVQILDADLKGRIFCAKSQIAVILSLIFFGFFLVFFAFFCFVELDIYAEK